MASSQSLQNEIEANYVNSENLLFGQRCNDIRQSLFNFYDPFIYIKFKDFELRVIDGLVEGVPYSGIRRKTYLIYADNQVIAKFYTLEEVGIAVRKIDFYLNKNNEKSDNLKILESLYLFFKMKKNGLSLIKYHFYVKLKQWISFISPTC